MESLKLTKDNKEIVVNLLGAEIKSFKKDGVEYLWNKEEYWNKTSPILFPIVGSLKDSKYIFDEKEYEMPKHGFARINFFEGKLNKDNLEFTLKYNKDTLKDYPFKFELKIIYTITENGFDIEYIVENIDEKDIYFSLGAHPAFKIDSSSYIEFLEKENLRKIKLSEKGLATFEYSEVKNRDNKIIDIIDENFKEDAIIFENTNSKSVYIRDNKGNEILCNYNNFPYIAFWKPMKAPFLCIEPWYGLPDYLDDNRDIINKKGILKLAPKLKFKSKLKFEFKRGI